MQYPFERVKMISAKLPEPTQGAKAHAYDAEAKVVIEFAVETKMDIKTDNTYHVWQLVGAFPVIGVLEPKPAEVAAKRKAQKAAENSAVDRPK